MLVEEEEEIPREEMDTESFFYDNLDFDILTNADLFYTKFEGKEGKDVWLVLTFSKPIASI